MAQRPRQHILETESRNAFRAIIPSSWVINSPQQDYGIDEEIQIFENGKSTPFIFLVQLKSALQSKTLNKISYSFSTERLNEYLKYPNPVLLVFYNTDSQKLYYKWTHEFYHELESKKRKDFTKQSKITIHFENELNTETVEKLFDEVKQYYFLCELLPENFEEIKIRLDLNINNLDSIQTKFRNWVRQNDKLSFIKFISSDSEDLLISGITDFGGISATTKNYYSTYPFLEKDGNENLSEFLLSSLKIILADYLAFSGKRNSALDIISQFLLDESLISSTAEIILTQQPWIAEYIFRKRNLEAFEIADKLVNSEYKLYSQLLAFSAQLDSSPNNLYQRKYKEFIHKSVKVAQSKRDKGISYYNLGGSFRASKSFREAIINYCKAAKHEPKYLEKSYWWAEIAGCLFLINKFRWAELCYRKSIELKEERIPVKYLLADSLIHQGKFSDAIKELESYLNENSKPIAGAVLVKWLAEYLFSKFGDLIPNKLKSKKIIEEAITCEDKIMQEDLFYEAIKQNPISDLAWFNYSISKRQLNQKNFEPLLVASILNPNDISLWIDLIYQITTNQLETEGFDRLYLATFSESGKYIAEIEDEIRNRLPEEFATPLFETIETIIHEANKNFLQRPEIILRPFGS